MSFLLFFSHNEGNTIVGLYSNSLKYVLEAFLLCLFTHKKKLLGLRCRQWDSFPFVHIESIFRGKGKEGSEEKYIPWKFLKSWTSPLVYEAREFVEVVAYTEKCSQKLLGDQKKWYHFKKNPQFFSAAGGIFRQKTQTERTYLK